MEKPRLIDRLRSTDKMTPSETKIADFFVRSSQQIAFESVTSIGEKCGVSKATVARFINRLGYESFYEFQELIQGELLERLQSPIERFSKAKSPEALIDFLDRSLNTAERNIQETRNRLSGEDFQRAVDLMAENKGSLYVLGTLSTFGPASFFWLVANYLRPNVILLDNIFANLPNQLINVGPNDVLLTVCHRRYSRQSTITLEYFSRTGAKVILVTDSELSPGIPLADVALVVPCSGIGMFDSGCAKLAVIEALAEALAQKLEKTLHERFEIMDNLFKEFNIFNPVPDHPLVGRVHPKK